MLHFDKKGQNPCTNRHSMHTMSVTPIRTFSSMFTLHDILMLQDLNMEPTKKIVWILERILEQVRDD
jgi:hypothetical protein